jgi:hypothetical protein
MGLFFVLRTDCGGTTAGWRQVTDLIEGTPGGARQLDELIDGVADRLSTDDQRLVATQRWIAASVLQLGWAAHLTSIYAGSLALGGTVPDLAATNVYYRPLGSGRFELGVDSPVALDAQSSWRRLSQDHLDPLADAIRRQVRIGRRLFHGNVASALAGSLATIARAGYAPLDTIVNQPWARPPDLSTHGRWIAGTDGPRYTRTTCCGYEQLPQGNRCGDCSLPPRTAKSVTVDISMRLPSRPTGRAPSPKASPVDGS